MVHNSLFLVAHFHNVIIGGVVFGCFAAVTYWWPKAFGFRLDERWGHAAFWCAFIGFWVTFAPLYVTGVLGMTRRLQHIDVPEWRPYLYVSAVGIVILAVGAVCQVMQIAVSILHREKLRDRTGDPWDGRSLEWATPSPPPIFNFAVLPNVEGEEAYWFIKQRAFEDLRLGPEPKYHHIEMPKNSPTGFVTAFFATLIGFALIWHIWWLAAASFVSLIATAIAHTFNYDRDFHIPAEEVLRVEDLRTRQLAEQA
jgi:cytochrome o ubiquinol oxidase subunit 1